MAPSNPISRQVSEALHELLDIVSAVQHTIVDPLNDMTREEIESLVVGDANLCNILSDTVKIVAGIDGLNRGRGKGLGATIQDELDRAPRWNSGPSGIVRSGDWDARTGNEELKHVPGISRSTVEGLLSTNIPQRHPGVENGLMGQIIGDLQRFIEPLEAIVSTLRTWDTRMIKSSVQILIDRIMP